MNDSKIHAIMIASIILSLAVVAAFTPDSQVNAETHLKSFTSYDELRNFVNASSQGSSRDSAIDRLKRMWGLDSPTLMGSTEVNTLPDYSLTNVQVEGVDEADIVKTDGTYIYVISKQTVIMLKAYPPEEAQILSKLTFEGNIRGIFINQDKLVVFEDTGYYYDYYGYYKPTAEPGDYQSPKTSIRIYNIADRANPTSVRNVSVGGNYFSSRMIADYAYVVVNQEAITYAYQLNVTIPAIYYDDRTEQVPPTQIFYANITDCFNTYVNVLAINILNDNEAPTEKSYLIGTASTMYVSQNNIYITYSTYNHPVQGTKIHRISIDEGEITYQASGDVPGYVLNQFSIDEYNGYFRIATTVGEVWATAESPSQNNIYILDMELDTVGMLEELAPGEKIHSARFMGNRCYLVTFKKIDPLFVIDLSDPTSPQVLGQLKIPGYSDYLHPYDENHIIGVGKETVEGEGGNFAWYQGVKISLFDVSDVAVPKEIDKYIIGDRGTDSPILADHKAFLFDKERNLLVIPVRVAEIDEAQYPNGIPDNAYGSFVWDGAYVFHISLEGLELRGTITHTTDTPGFAPTGYYNSQYSIQRSLYIDNVLYTISELKIKMNSLTDLSEIGEIKLSP